MKFVSWHLRLNNGGLQISDSVHMQFVQNMRLNPYAVLLPLIATLGGLLFGRAPAVINRALGKSNFVFL
jgi:hypothetical protein